MRTFHRLQKQIKLKHVLKTLFPSPLKFAKLKKLNLQEDNYWFSKVYTLLKDTSPIFVCEIQNINQPIGAVYQIAKSQFSWKLTHKPKKSWEPKSCDNHSSTSNPTNGSCSSSIENQNSNIAVHINPLIYTNPPIGVLWPISKGARIQLILKTHSVTEKYIIQNRLNTIVHSKYPNKKGNYS